MPAFHVVFYSLALAILAGCSSGSTDSASSERPNVSAEVARQMAARYGEPFTAEGVGGGVNEGNAFSGNAPTWQLDAMPTARPSVRAHVFVTVEGGQVVIREENYLQVVCEAALGVTAFDAMKSVFPATAAVCVSTTYANGTEPDPETPTLSLDSARLRVFATGMNADAVLTAVGPIRQAALALEGIGMTRGQVEVVFFSTTVVPAPLDTTPCTRQNTTGLTVRQPILIFPLSAEAFADYRQDDSAFASRTHAIGFGRRGYLNEVLERFGQAPTPPTGSQVAPGQPAAAGRD